MGYAVVSYRSPGQISYQSDDFLSFFEKFFDDVQIFQPALGAEEASAPPIPQMFSDNVLFFSEEPFNVPFLKILNLK